MAQNHDGTLTPKPAPPPDSPAPSTEVRPTESLNPSPGRPAANGAEVLRRVAGKRSDDKLAAMQALMHQMMQPDPARERAMSLVATINALRGRRGSRR